MAQLQDITGRLITMEGELSSMTGVLRQLLGKKDMGSAIPYMKEEKKSSEARNLKLEDLKKVMQTLSDDFKEEMKNTEKYIDDIKDAIDGIKANARPVGGGKSSSSTMGLDRRPAGGSSGEGKLLAIEVSLLKSIQKDIKHLVREATTTGCLHVVVDKSKQIDTTNQLLSAQIKEKTGKDITIDAEQIAGSAASGKSGSAFPDKKESKEAGEEAGKTWKESFFKAGVFGTMSAAITGVIQKFDPIQNMFKGVVKDEMEFMINMRATAFEVDGISSSTRKLQEEWQKTGKVVGRTGVNLSDFQKQYVKNLRGGTISQKEALDVTKSGLHVSQMLGSSAEQTSDTFMQWHKTMGLNQNQMAQLGRNLQDVARLTGVTGDNLMEIVKSSEQFVKAMRNAGQLTAEAAGNITGLLASSQKLGVGDQAEKVMGALKGTVGIFNEADDKTKALLFNAASVSGRVNDLMAGTVMKSKSAIKDMAGGIEHMVLQVVGGSWEAYDNMDDLTKGFMNMQVQNAFGIQADEARRLIEAMQEGAMTYGERLDKIDEQLKTQNLTLEERTNLLEQQANIQMSGGFDMLNKFDEAAKKGGTMAEAAGKALAGSEDLRNNLESLGVEVDLQNPVKTLEKAALFTAEKLKEAGGEDFTSKIQDALSSGDMVKMREVMSDMNAAQQTLATDTKKGLDPMTEMGHNLNKLNEIVREFTGPALRYMSSMLMWLTIIAGSLASLVSIAIGLSAMKTGVFAAIGKVKGFFQGSGSGGGTPDVFAKGMDLAKKYVPKQVQDLFATGMGKAKNVVSKAFPSLFSPELYSDKIGKQAQKGMGALKEKLMAKHAGKLQSAQSVMSDATGGGDAPKFSTDGISKMGDKLKQAGPAILKAAVGLALAAGAVIILIKLLQAVGIDSKAAFDGALTITIIIGSLAVIAGAAYAASKGLELIGKQAGAIEKAVPAMLKGALVIGLMAPAIVLLASTIAWVSQKILGLFGLDPGVAVEIAKNVGELLLATAAIITGCAAGIAILIGIGKVVSWLSAAWTVLLPLLGIGIAAVLLGVPLLLTVAASVVKIAQGILGAFGLDSETAAKVAEDVVGLLISTGKIITGCAAGIAILMGIGKIAIWLGAAWLVVLPLLGAGIAAVLLGVPLLLTVAASVVKIAQFILGITGLDPSTIAQVVETIESLGNAVKSIGGMFNILTENLLPLVDGVRWAFWKGSPLNELQNAMPQVYVSLIILSCMFSSLIKTLEKLFPGDTRNVLVAANLMTMIGTMSKAIAEALGTMGKELVPLTSGWVLGLWGDSPLEDLEEEMPIIFKTLVTLSKLFSGLLPELEKLFPGDTRNVLVAANLMTMIGTMSKATAEALGTMGKELVPLTSGWVLGLWGDSPLEDLEEEMPIIFDTLVTLSELFSGLLPELERLFPGDTRNVLVAANLMTMIGTMSKATAEALGTMGKELVPLTSGWVLGYWGDSPLEDLEEEMPIIFDTLVTLSELFSGLLPELERLFPGDTRNVLVAANLMKMIGMMSKATAEALGIMATELVPLTEGGWFTDSTLQKLSDNKDVLKTSFEDMVTFFKEAIIEPLEELPEIEKMQELLEKLEAMSKVMGTLAKVTKNMSNSTEKLTSGGGKKGGSGVFSSIGSAVSGAAGLGAKAAKGVFGGAVGLGKGALGLGAKAAKGVFGGAVGLGKGALGLGKGALNWAGSLFSSKEPQNAEKEIANMQAKNKGVNEKILNQVYSDGLVNQTEKMQSKANQARSSTLHNVSKSNQHLDKSIGSMKSGITGYFDKIGGFFSSLTEKFKKQLGLSEEASDEAVKAENAIKKETKISESIATNRAAEESAAKAISDEQKTGLKGTLSMAAKHVRKEQTPEQAVKAGENIQSELSRLSTASGSRVLRGGVDQSDFKAMQKAYNQSQSNKPSIPLAYDPGFNRTPRAKKQKTKDNFTKWNSQLSESEKANIDPNMVWEKSATEMAAGGSFIARGPTPLMVGEAGMERVTVTPGGSGIPDLEEKAGAMAAAAAKSAVFATATSQPQISSAPLTDVYDRMHQEQTGAEAGPVKFQSSELNAIEDASNQQVDHLAHIGETLEIIQSLLTPKGSSMSGMSPAQLMGSTASQTTSWGSSDYGKWQFGRHAGNAANQVVNDGVN